ncbi:hypothetical protein FOMPIDRAFT_1130523 [Fomitopsis schrenkii]|uniref:Uncharacterized protein n=1 Tax=Fomitopsis schrenkii TaxID=2126942 RepID=S8DZ33_FOMSC|nr:hypothetical protein FOMPIDRAFT_1130523 [Fomitopsis schrenkii]
MQKCTELSRLPKAAKNLKSLNFKGTTPGSATGFVSSGYIDPTHPATRPGSAKPRAYFESAHLSIRAIPKATLRNPTCPVVAPFPPSKRVFGRVHVSLQKTMSTAELPTAVIRSKIATKIKTALSMIVTRGADVQKDAKGKERIVFNQRDARPDWILHDWTYVFRPMLQLYQMPYKELIPILRDGLQSLRSRAQRLESQWQSREPASRRADSGKGGGRVKEVATGLDTPRHAQRKAVLSSRFAAGTSSKPSQRQP